MWTDEISTGFFTFQFDGNFLKNRNFIWKTGVKFFISLQPE